MYELSPVRSGAGGLDLADPRWFPDDLNLATGKARFLRVSREELSRQPFLDPRWKRAGLAESQVPAVTLDASDGVRPRLNFIWHTSYCCSTVLATALDRTGVSLSLKEPQVLVGLANLKRGQGGMLKRPALARALFALLARRFSPDERVLVKPSNFTNNLLPEAAEMTDGRMLMLYSSCRDFLISIAKANESRRGFPRELFVSLSMDQSHPQAKWPAATLIRLTDLQIAAVAWRMQVAEMRRAMDKLGDRAVSLDADRFDKEPRAVLNALDRFFGLGLGACDEAAWLGRDVKTGAARDEKARRRDAARMEGELGPALDRIVEWSARVCGVPAEAEPLDQPLLT